MKMRTGLFATCATLAVLLVSGCGGSDAPSKEEYVAQADQICLDADTELNATIEEQFAEQQPTEDAIAAFAEDELVPNLEGQLAELRDLTPPEGEEETLASIYDTLDAAITKIADDPLSAARTPPEEMKEASRIAREFGMTECGSD